MRYIILNPDKTPSENLSEGGHSLKEVKRFCKFRRTYP